MSDVSKDTLLEILQQRMDKCTNEQFWAVAALSALYAGILSQPALPAGVLSAEEQHLCEACFERTFQQHPEVLQQLRKAEAEAKTKDGMSCGWTSYTPNTQPDDS